MYFIETGAHPMKSTHTSTTLAATIFAEATLAAAVLGCLALTAPGEGRWLDKYPEAFAAYNKALTLEPTHKGALNYSGIAYLKSGQKAKAQEQLAKLTQLCAQCEETTQLAQAIASAP
jgi:Flp pilus assembly protein TadD